jgi:hypothetical protein
MKTITEFLQILFCRRDGAWLPVRMGLAWLSHATNVDSPPNRGRAQTITGLWINLIFRRNGFTIYWWCPGAPQENNMENKKQPLGSADHKAHKSSAEQPSIVNDQGCPPIEVFRDLNDAPVPLVPRTPHRPNVKGRTKVSGGKTVRFSSMGSVSRKKPQRPRKPAGTKCTPPKQ